MSPQITWTIQQMRVCRTLGEFTDVVVDVSWVCSGQRESGESVIVKSFSNVCSLPQPENSFTSYDQLNQDQVLDWVWNNGVDKQAIEDRLLAELSEAVSPTVVTPALPWAQQ